MIRKTVRLLVLLIVGVPQALIVADGSHEVVVPCPGIRTGAYVPNCQCGSAAIGFEGVALTYDRLLDVRVNARNVSGDTLYSDPNQAGIPLLFRWNDTLRSWDEVGTWRCSNVGQGTKRSILPNKTIGLDIRNSSAVVDLDQGPSVILFDDTELPTTGRYRLGLRYSTEFWPALVDMLSDKKFKGCKLQLSGDFSVNR